MHRSSFRQKDPDTRYLIPGSMSFLSESLDVLAKRRADRPAIIEASGDASQPNRTIGFEALAMRARSIGQALVARGFAGARIALVLGPGIDFVSALFGIFYAGGCAVPLSRRVRPFARRVHEACHLTGEFVLRSGASVSSNLGEPGFWDDGPATGRGTRR